MTQLIDIEAIKKLSVEERMAIIRQIWETIPDEEIDFTVSEEAKAEMKRRASELRENPELGLSHEEVMAWLRGKSWS